MKTYKIIYKTEITAENKEEMIKKVIEDFKNNIPRIETEIEIGNFVKVIDAGKCYSTYTSFFGENHIDIEIAARYSFNESMHNGDVFKVIGVGRHCHTDVKIYVVKECIYCGKVFLIGEDGIEPCDEE